MKPIDTTILATLINYKKRDGYYNLVFRNENVSEDSDNRYIWVTIPPNWGEVVLDKDKVVHLNYVTAKAGSTYYNSKTDTYDKYKTTANWYKDSVPASQMISSRIMLAEA